MNLARMSLVALVAAACAADDSGTVLEYAPPPGRSVRVETIFEDGATAVRVIATALDGTVAEDAERAPEVMALARAEPAHPCDDDAFTPLEFRVGFALSWSFEARSTTNALEVDAVEAALERGSAAVTRSRNVCDLDDELTALDVYAGRTQLRAGVDSGGGCTIPDGENVVSFGPLPDGVLAIGCTWLAPDGMVTEDDVRLAAHGAWYTSRPEPCDGAFGIESVVAHLRGHTFGLGHVSAASHGNLVMSDTVRGCVAEARLGLGDVLGLREKY